MGISQLGVGHGFSQVGNPQGDATGQLIWHGNMLLPFLPQHNRVVGTAHVTVTGGNRLLVPTVSNSIFVQPFKKQCSWPEVDEEVNGTHKARSEFI